MCEKEFRTHAVKRKISTDVPGPSLFHMGPENYIKRVEENLVIDLYHNLI